MKVGGGLLPDLKDYGLNLKAFFKADGDRGFIVKNIEPALKIVRPCSEDWNAMEGDERKRFCAQCGKHVFNLSAMTPREGQAFAEETQGRVCVAYVRSEEGKIISPNCIERLMLRFSGRLPRMAAMISLLLPAALASCADRKAVSQTITSGIPRLPPQPVTRHVTSEPDGRLVLGKVRVSPQKND
jgi:hypothetical protein